MTGPDMSHVDDGTLAARAIIVEHAETLFPLLARSKRGREELMRHRGIALQRMREAKEPAEFQWAMIMHWHIDRALPARKRPRKRAAKPIEAERIEHLATMGADMLMLALLNLPDDQTPLRAELREAAYRFQRIARLAKPGGTH